jgi:hypothetical protein
MSDNQYGGQGNPNWNEFWESIPEQYREEVQPNLTPVLEKWDQNVQKRFESYKPYERYVRDGVDPQVIEYGMNLMNKIDSNDGAMEVFGQLGQYLESQGLLSTEDDEYEEEEDGEFDYDSLPPQLRRELDELRGAYGTLAEHNLMQQQQKIEAQEDAALDAELSKLRSQQGDFDDEWVLAKMVNGYSAEDAVTSYHEWLDKTLQGRNKTPAYRPMGGGGDFPSSGQVSPRKMNDVQTKEYVTQLLFDTYKNR